MSTDTWQFLGILITAVVTLTGIYFSNRKDTKKTRSDAAQGLIDQLQEERNQLVARMDSHNRECKAEIAALRTELDRFSREHLDLLDYAQGLRHWIRTNKGPPPPEWPASLRVSV